MISDDIQETNELLGVGTYGKVLKVFYYGAICVAKELSSTPETDSLKVGTSQNDSKDYFLKKCQPLTQLRHPNIVQFFGIHFKPDPSRNVRPIMVMEKMETSLSALLESEPNISIGVKLSILLDVSLGLRYLHSQRPAVVHCNLTSNNVLLTSQLQAKISDVGITQMMGNGQQLQKKSALFVAPENRTDTSKLSSTELACQPSVDIFSYGAVVLHTITQQWPQRQLGDAVRQGDTIQTEVQKHRSQINQIATKSKALKSLVLSCLDNDPDKRPTIIQVSEILRRLSEKLPVVNKSPIAWQAEVEDATKQLNELEKKVINEIKTRKQLQMQNENLRKLIQVNYSEFEGTLKKLNDETDSTEKTVVKQLEQEASSSNKKGKANSLQYRLNKNNVLLGFQLILKKDSSHSTTNSAIEYVQFHSNLEDLPVAIIKCPYHPFMDLSKFCLDCEVELCYDCTKHHSGHTVKYFSVLTMNHDSMEKDVREMLKNINTKKTKFDRKNMEIQKRAKETNEEVKKGFSNLHKIIDIQEKKVLKRLALQVENIEKEHGLYFNIYSVYVAQLKSFLNTIEHARLVSKKEFFKVSKSLLQYGNSLLSIGKDLKMTIHNELIQIPPDKFESICDGIASLGISPDAKFCSVANIPKTVFVNTKTTLKVVMKDNEGYTVSNCKDKLTVELRSATTLMSRNVPVDVTELTDGVYEVSLSLKYCGEYYLKIMVCGANIPGMPCKITCKFSSDWTPYLTPSFMPTITPPPIPDAAISDKYQFKIKPLKNHSSNCYLNSVLQAFGQTTAMVEIGTTCKNDLPRHYKLKGLSSGDNLSIKLSGRIGTLHEKFQALFEEIDLSKNISPIDPQTILQLIATKYPRFGKRTQEDSHEVLRCLLTEMKNEELEKIGEKVHLNFGIDKDQSLSSLDGETKLRLKNYLRVASSIGKTPIEKVVGGVRVNTIICRKCHTPMQSEEPFFDISLHVPDNVSTTQTYSGRSLPNINKQQSYSTSQQYPYKQSSYIEASALTKQDGSIPLDAEGVQSLLVAENMFHQPTTGMKHPHNLTGLEQSLAAHTSVDNMDENNKFVCTECNKSTSGEVLSFLCKQILFHKLPQVLILHLKRFTIGAYTVLKNKTHVSFPPLLDMAPYSSNTCLESFGDENNKILYGLYAVVEHMGATLSAGHYIAYVRRRPKRDNPKSSQAAGIKGRYDEAAATDGVWFRTSDLTIRECVQGFKAVEGSEAYLLFYELLPIKFL